MNIYTLSLTYTDGHTVNVRGNADSPADAVDGLLQLALRQLYDPSWGGERDRGMPVYIVVRDYLTDGAMLTWDARFGIIGAA